MRGVLNRLVLVLAAPGSQLEVVVQENEDALRFLDPQQELVPLVGTVQGETRSFPSLLLEVSDGERCLHDDVEQLVTLLGDFVLREGGDQLHDFQGVVDLVGRSGVLNVPVSFTKILGAFVTAKG